MSKEQTKHVGQSGTSNGYNLLVAATDGDDPALSVSFMRVCFLKFICCLSNVSDFIL